MQLYWPKSGSRKDEHYYFSIPMREIMDTFVKLAGKRMDAFIERFNRLPYKRQLGMLETAFERRTDYEMTHRLGGVFRDGVAGTFGATESESHDCGISSGSSMTTRTSHFMTGKRGIHFRASRDAHELELAPVIPTHGNIYVHTTKIAFSTPHREIKEGDIDLRHAMWTSEGVYDVEKRQQPPYQMQLVIPALVTGSKPGDRNMDILLDELMRRRKNVPVS